MTALFPAIGATWPLVVVLYTCGVAGRWPIAATTVGVFLAVGIPARLIVESEQLLPVVYSSLREAAIAGLALMLGDAVRTRRQLTAERDKEARARVLEERLRIARELHDITAHTLAVVGVQLNVAADAADPEEMRDAAQTARQVNRDAVTELRAALAMLRDDSGPTPTQPAPQPGARRAGRDHPGGRVAGALPRDRAADAAAVDVNVDYRPDGVAVSVTDDGAGPVRGNHNGHGIVGMRERAVGLGGEFEAGPRPEGGFIVRAWLPT